MDYNARSGYTLSIGDQMVVLSWGKQRVTFNKSEISQVEIKKSPYDLPLLEKTLVLHLSSGKKYKIKRLPKGQANQAFNELSA